MVNEPKVWIRKRKTKRGTSYHLRWICPTQHKWRSKCVGSDSRFAQRELVKMEQELRSGAYRDIQAIPWDDFIAEVVGFLHGSHAEECRRTLLEFGQFSNVRHPKDVQHANIRAYV